MKRSAQKKVKRMKTNKELIDAARMLRDYCEDHGTGCDGCVFDYDRGTRCRIGNYVVPERWALAFASRKEEER